MYCKTHCSHVESEEIHFDGIMDCSIWMNHIVIETSERDGYAAMMGANVVWRKPKSDLTERDIGAERHIIGGNVQTVGSYELNEHSSRNGARG